jgi:multiple sugar transport system permease protein
VALPFLAGLALFAVYPFVWVLAASFSKSTLGRSFQDWVGLANYAKALSEPKFLNSLQVSVGYALATTAGAMLLGVVTALLLDRAVRARDVVRTLILLPLLTPPVTVAIMWQLILMPKGGLINALLMSTGAVAEPISLLGEPGSAFFFLCLADVWQWSPFVALMTYAALQTLPEDVVEAAQIDGASDRRIFWSITLPMLLPALIGTALLKLVISFKAFDLVYVLTAGGPGQATTVASFNIYRVAVNQFDVGFAATQTVLFGIVVALVTLPFTKAYALAERRLS